MSVSLIISQTSEGAITEFNKKFGLLKAKLTNAEKFLNKEEKATNEHEFKSRTTSLETTFVEYNSLINSFISIIDEEKLANYVTVFEKFEDRYHGLIGKIKSECELLNLDHHSINEAEESAPNESLEKILNVIQSKSLKLPEVKFPIFDGSDLTQWTTFRDLFVALIHDNNNLDEIVKFTYLLDKLRGDARESIGHITLNKISYERAWETIIRLYDNPRAIVDKHIEALLNLDPIVRRKESEIRKLLNVALSHISALSANNLQLDDLSQLIILKIVNRKLDSITRGEWEESIDHTRQPSWEEFKLFLEKKCRVLREVENSMKPLSMVSFSRPKPLMGSLSKQAVHKTIPKREYSYVSNKVSLNCDLCGKEQHPYFLCHAFNNLAPQQRYEKIKLARACVNCFNPNHKTPECRSIRCRISQGLHHTLLHFESPKQTITNKSITQHQLQTEGLPSGLLINVPKLTDQGSGSATSNLTSSPISKIDNYHINNGFAERSTILPTALVMIEDNNGKLIQCRALLDSGSQTNFISESFAKILNLTCRKNNHLTVTGLNCTTSQVSQSITTTLHSNYKSFPIQLEFYIVNSISNRIPYNTINISRWQIPNHVKLSDPFFNVAQPIDILLGVEIFPEILLPNRINLPSGLPIIHESIFGWIVFGKFEENIKHNFSIFQTPPNANDELNENLKRFWELENVPSKKFFSAEEKTCETYFNQTTTRDVDGRYIVSIPFRDNLKNLGESKSIALKRFLHLEQKLNRNLKLKVPYVKFVNEYLELNHMKLINDTNDSEQIAYYMPHHAVERPTSSSTKLRVVFDASTKTSSNTSLNEKMLVGPTIQDNLFDIILRFRTYKYVISSDISKMYRQIKINESQTPLQRILWRENLNQPIQTNYKLQTVTNGTASAPYLAIRVLSQLANDERKNFSLAAEIATKDFYVDDLITGSNDLKIAKQIQFEMVQMLKRGGFHLHKWYSNDEQLLNDVPIKDREELKYNEFSLGNCIKTLGLLWQPQEDIFVFKPPKFNEHSITKRTIVSDIAKLYDPLGLLSPIIITGKILIQTLWKMELAWDDIIVSELQEHWINYQKTLKSISQIKLYRNVMGHTKLNDIVKTELHGFCDASEKAYGACLYIKTIDSINNVSVTLLCSKSRVAPLKTLSLPRLELSGALLLANLTNSTINALNLNFTNIYLWSDSTITLCWIKTPPYKLKTFIANRVNEIQQSTQEMIWKHVESAENPADLISRGVMPNELSNNYLWWYGPKFLLTGSYDSLMTATVTDFDPSVLELKQTSTVMISSRSDDFINSFLSRFSSLEKLVRVNAYISRFIKREELKSLQFNQTVSRKSTLKSLNPFIDSEGLIRVGGRLSNATNLNYDVKHQILLPSKSELTTLIFRHEHLKNLHPGSQLLLSFVRQKYWPIHGKNIAKRITRSCVNCFRTKPTVSQQIMGDLPIERVSSFKAFLNIGVDFCGPFSIKFGTIRKAPITKMYVASFICLSTKAIHLEIIQNLTTDSFIFCLKRFINRQGKISNIWSDNASTFHGTNNELKEFHNLWQSQAEQTKIAEFCSFERISWKFIPPRAPNFGGIWEASIKSFKTHLKRVTRDRILCFEEFNTLIVQIEGILNSRPLSVMSGDPNDPEPLTPGHFLTGNVIVTLPEPSYNHLAENRLSRYQLISKLTESFWKRYSVEYLHNLQTRSKWTTVSTNIKPGDVVLLIQDNLPPTKWPLSIIISTVAGADGKVRVVTAETIVNGIKKNFKRSISEICKLPIDV